MKINFDALNQALLVNFSAYCRQWLPDGKLSDAEYSACNPTRSDAHAGSFSINTYTGIWADFATGDKGSDPVSLYAYLFTSNDQGRAGKELTELLGLSPLDKPVPELKKPRTDWIQVVPPLDYPEPHRAHIKRGFPDTVYAYRNIDNSVLGFMYRFVKSDGEKAVLPLTWCKNSVTKKEEWRWMGFATPRPLFNLQELGFAAGKPVLIVEGEKCAVAAASALVDFACISWPGGTNAVDKVDWSPLAGLEVIIWPDADSAVDANGDFLPESQQAGMKAACKIEQILLGLQCRVSILDIPKPGIKKHGWDIADAIDEGLKGEDLRAWINKNSPSATSSKPAVPVDNDFEPIASAGHLLARYALVYAHGGTVFDFEKRVMLKQSDMIDACISREYAKQWQQSASRKIVSIENVGFDPGEKDLKITCNLWSGWPTVPKKGDCSQLLKLIRYMCNCEEKEAADTLFDWLIKWMAYPIQHPGAKMKSSVVIHGPQGTGKNLVFECYMEIYGNYGRIIGQDAIEDRFNDWASKKLFLIADEVVARSDLYHVKNKLKSFITGDYIRINPKNLMAYEERNHVNLVFLSNERMPVVLEEDDRRHAVIWTPEKATEDFYKSVAEEKANGSVAAFHQFLLDVDLGDFSEHSKPPMTLAKKELIDLSKDTINRFFEEWEAGFIDGFTVMPVLSQDFYELYKIWCGKQGVKPGSQTKMVDMMLKRLYCSKKRTRYLSAKHPQTFIFSENCSDVPAGISEAAWLDKCVSEFRELLSNYRGRNYE
ncbi:MAG: DUF5906 domain-containing protein [Methylococcales bacterium]|nr:DUF5906 domain-containing protein [Methylococcales bacterium]